MRSLLNLLIRICIFVRKYLRPSFIGKADIQFTFKYMLIAFETAQAVQLEGQEITEFEESLGKTKERFYQCLPLQILKEAGASKRKQELDGSYPIRMALEDQSQTQT